MTTHRAFSGGCYSRIASTNKSGLCKACQEKDRDAVQMPLFRRQGFCVVCEIVRLSRADSGSVCMYCAEDALVNA